MDAIIEVPLKRRRYEAEWTIPARAVRCSVSSPIKYSETVRAFAEMLINTAKSEYRFLVECNELYEIPTAISGTDRITFVDMVESTGNLDAVSRSFNCVGSTSLAIRYNDVYWSFYIHDTDMLYTILSQLSPVEFYITLWHEASNIVPVQLEALSGKQTWNRLEQYYLENLGRYAAAVFLSPGHVDMELAVADEFLSRRVFDVVMRLCRHCRSPK